MSLISRPPVCQKIPPDFVPFDPADIETPLARLLERQVERAPERIAVRAGMRQLSYGALNAAANRLARQIIERSGESNEAVALLLPVGIPTLIAALAIVKAGKIYAPVDLAAPPERARFVLENTQARLLLSDRPRLERAAELAAGLCDVLDLETIDAGRDDNLPFAAPPTQPTFLLHTSGSTGQPKGVLHNQYIITWFFDYYNNECALAASDRTMWLSPPGVIGVTRDMFCALSAGATIFPRDMADGEFVALARLMLDERITIAGFGATLFRHLIAAIAPEQQFPDVRLVKLGAEVITRADVENVCRHFPRDGSLVTTIGSTEVGLFRRLAMSLREPFAGSVVPAGYAIAGKEVLILDEEGGEVAPGQTGEIAIRSPYLALGYWRQATLSEEKFRPAANGARIFLTGDLGRIRPDGCLEHLGRKDQQLKVRGYRVEAAEVELLLVKAEGVQEAAVAIRPDANGENRLVAYIIPSTNPGPTVSALRQVVAGRLPAYMVPSTFVFMQAFPLASSGKVNRRLLPAPSPERPPLSVKYTAPRSASEQALARIWSAVLGVEPVGVNDPFLDLGGHSLQAARIIARVLAEFRVELAVRTLFESATVAAMASVIAGAQAEQIGAARLEELLRGLEALPEAEAVQLLARPAAS